MQDEQQDTRNEQWDTIVVGGGPAGLSAALMLGRARRRVLVIDSGRPRNRAAEHMHGVLGNEGTPPLALLERGRAEAEGYGVRFLAGSVDRLDSGDGGIRVTLAEPEAADAPALSARTALVATGVSDELPAIPGLAERWGRSVLHCPYCHGWEVRDRRLGVLTTSPASLHQAELVRQWSDRVTVFTAGLGEFDPARFRARDVDLVAAPVAAVADNGSGALAVRTEDGTETVVDALFTGGRPVPHDRFLAHLGLARAETPMGAFLAVDPTGRTSDERVWAAGNVATPAANVPMSIGAGAMAGAAINGVLVGEDFAGAVAEGRRGR